MARRIVIAITAIALAASTGLIAHAASAAPQPAARNVAGGEPCC